MFLFILSLLGSFLGSFVGSFLFLYYVNPPSGKSEIPKLEKKLGKDGIKPKGTILKSEEPDMERKRKLQEFERKVYSRKETIL